MSAVSKSINDYLRKHTDDKTTKSVCMACPFSLRPPPKTLGDFTFNNDFSIVPLNLRLIDNYDTGLHQINSDMNVMKKSISPIVLAYLLKLVMMLPEFLRAYLNEDLSNKMTFGFSNVPGPKTPYKCAGSETKSLSFIMPVGKTVVGSFSIISHAKVVKMAVVMDKATMPSVSPLAEILKNNLDEVLGGPKWRLF